jgi:hypothetical protein
MNTVRGLVVHFVYYSKMYQGLCYGNWHSQSDIEILHPAWEARDSNKEKLISL